MAIASRQIRNLDSKELRMEGYFEDKEKVIRKWDIMDDAKYRNTLNFTAANTCNVFYLIAHFTDKAGVV